MKIVAFSPDGYMIVSNSFDNTTKLWEKATGSLLKTFKGYQDWVNSIRWEYDCEWF